MNGMPTERQHDLQPEKGDPSWIFIVSAAKDLCNLPAAPIRPG